MTVCFEALEGNSEDPLGRGSSRKGRLGLPRCSRPATRGLRKPLGGVVRLGVPLRWLCTLRTVTHEPLDYRRSSLWPVDWTTVDDSARDGECQVQQTESFGLGSVGVEEYAR